MSHPAVALFGVSFAVALGLRALFFSISTWLWHFARTLDPNDLLPWTRWAMWDRDGAEPYGLVGAVAAEWLMTALCMWGLARLPSRVRALLVLVLLLGASILVWHLPVKPAMTDEAQNSARTYWFVSGCLFATWLFGWLLPKRRLAIPVLLAVFLIPVCFVRVTGMNGLDTTTILAPALRLQHGFSLREIYFQYDLFPSLLALAVSKAGGHPIAYVEIVSAAYYVLFVGLFFIARRLLRPALVMPLLVCVGIVRYYAIVGDIAPQVTPLRLDLWLLPLGLVLVFGLRHWALGLALGGLLFFSRSIGTLYLGAYALTVGANFLALRLALPRAEREPWLPALTGVVRESVFVWAPILASLVAGRIAFGNFTSDAVRLYREIGLGMMRIDPSSFYWALLALTGGVGWLAFSRRAKLPTRAGEATIFAVALMVASSTYFFGRSHEHNLLNIAASFLFCAFLGLDLAWPSEADGVPLLRGIFRALPWALVGTCAYLYWTRAADRVFAQYTFVMNETPVLQSNADDQVPHGECLEIAHAADDDRLFFFSGRDFWYYYHCRYVPVGYMQPLHLAILKKPLVSQLRGLLASGYKIVVPRGGNNEDVAAGFPEIVPDLPPLVLTNTAHFQIYRQGP